jgi:hypothetical protein
LTALHSRGPSHDGRQQSNQYKNNCKEPASPSMKGQIVQHKIFMAWNLVWVKSLLIDRAAMHPQNTALNPSNASTCVKFICSGVTDIRLLNTAAMSVPTGGVPRSRAKPSQK